MARINWMIASWDEVPVIIWMFPKIVGFPPKSSILVWCSIINHAFWGTLIFGNTHIRELVE